MKPRFMPVSITLLLFNSDMSLLLLEKKEYLGGLVHFSSQSPRNMQKAWIIMLVKNLNILFLQILLLEAECSANMSLKLLTLSKSNDGLWFYVGGWGGGSECKCVDGGDLLKQLWF